MEFKKFADEWLPKVDSNLEKLTRVYRDGPEKLYHAIRTSLLSPGKRVRPLLTLGVSKTFGAHPATALDMACTTEMIHASSLILDDLPCMDNATLRRGKPACHIQHGEDIAILAAFELLNRAYEILLAGAESGSRERYEPADFHRVLTNAVGFRGMVGGQTLDLHPPSSMDFDTLETIHSHKTGALFVASALLGAMAARAKRNSLDRMEIFAKNLGLAFQIQDDLMDVLSTPEITGKEALAPRRKSFVDLFGPERCREAVDQLFHTAIQSLDGMAPHTDLLRSFIHYVWKREV